MKNFEMNWKSQDGMDIFARGWEPNGALKAAVCLVHGLGEHIGRYAHVAGALCKKGYALFGADQRGHGLSSGSRGHAASFEGCMQDIDLLIEQARSHYPGLPVFLYGHSNGGTLVLNYGIRRRPDLKGVIVTAPSLHNDIEHKTFKVMLAGVLGSLLPGVLVSTGLDPNMLSHDREIVKAYVKDPLVHDKMSLGYGKTMLSINKWTLEHASEFSLPLLLMHGKNDMLAFPSSSIEFASALKDQCTLMLWDDMYHEIHNELAQSDVFQTMTIWMDARLLE
jgi:alpha-beta hydrolase superfamily lysophospholipase